MKKFGLVLLMIFLGYSGANAQWVAIDSLHDYCWACHNDQHYIGQPYTHTFKKELPSLILSGGAFAAGFIMDGNNKTPKFTQEQLNSLDKNSINAFDRVAVGNWSPSIASISDYTLIGITLLPIMFLSEHHTGKDFKSLAVMSVEVFAVNYGATYIVKNAVNRTRPYVYNSDRTFATRTDKESRKSFYSGHTSQTAAAAFFFAKVISDYHPDLKRGIKTGVWAFAITVPAIEAYLRVKGGRHYPTDVIAGYALGAFSGWLIPELHRNFTYGKQHPKKTNLDMGLFPVKNGMVMNLSYKF